MAETARQSTRERILFEVALFLGLFFFGFVLMPIAIWVIGQSVFGAYGGTGYADFFGTLSARIRSGSGAAWFLVLSPYIGVAVLRLMVLGLRRTGHPERAA